MKLEGKVLTFGEIMMRLSPPDHLRLEQANSFDVRYGGAEANVAFSLAYQKDDAAFVSIVPESRIGDCALRSLSAYGVDVSRVVRKGDRLSFNMAAIVRQYFDITSIPGTFSLNLPPYAQGRMERSPENFLKVLQS